MEPPNVNLDLCKAIECRETCINDNYCGYHTHKLHPIYLRYKRLETKIEIVSSPETQYTVPDLMRIYTRYARVYELRVRYRSLIKAEHRDEGHDYVIYQLSVSMDRISDLLHKLTQSTDDIAPTEIPLDNDVEIEDDQPDMTLNEINRFDQSRRKKTWNHTDSIAMREPCILAAEKSVVMAKNRLTQTLNLTVTTRLSKCSHLTVVRGWRYQVVDTPEHMAMLVHNVLGIAAQGHETVINKRDFSARGSIGVSRSICCFKKIVEVIIRHIEILEIAIIDAILYSSWKREGIKGYKLLTLATRYRPPDIVFEIYAPGVFPPNSSTTRKIPISAYEHICECPRAYCETCVQELNQHLAYKTLPGHISDL